MPVINQTWSRHRILAEIKERGFTAVALEKSLGLKHGDICVAFNRPYPKTEEALAKWLGVPLFELWPDRYYSNGSRRVQQKYPNRKITNLHSKKEIAA